MATTLIPPEILNVIDGRECPADGGETFPKLNPASGERLCDVARELIVVD